ncbi:MAG: hypothetical protein ACW977_06815 [Candidatus Thorarchaeota archaeon]|jgi:hypothetical protein
MISFDDILKELSVTSEEEALERITIEKIEREGRRRLGMYVDMWEEESGQLSITSPDDISEKRASDAIVEVENTHDLLGNLLKIYDAHPPLIEILQKNYEERKKEIRNA